MIRVVLKTLGVLILLPLVWLAVLSAAIWSYGAQDQAKPADCAIVLGAAVYGTRPSPVF